MAEDSARLTIELLDRSGGNTATPAPGNSGGVPSIPGTDLAQQYQNQVTAQGAGSKAGSGSVAAPTTTPSSIPSATPTSTPTPVDVSQPLQANQGSVTEPDVELPFNLSQAGPLNVPSTPSTPPNVPVFSGEGPLGILKSLIVSGTTPTLQDVNSLGTFSKQEAQALLNAALGNNRTQPATPTPTGTPQPTSTGSAQLPDGPLNYYFNTTSAQRETEQMFGDTDAARAREAQTAMQQAAEIARTAASKREDANAPQPIDAQLSPIPGQAGMAARAIAQNLGTLAQGAIGGPLGTAIGLGVNAAGPAIASLASTSSLAPALAAAGPYVGAAVAAVGIPIALGAAVNNEANRAIELSRSYSPELAGELAREQVRQIIADFNTSRRLGDEAADFVNNRSRISTASQGLRDIVAEPILQDVNSSLKILAAAVTGLQEYLENNPTIVTALQDTIRAAFTQLLNTGIPGSGTLLQLLATIGAWFDEDDEVKVGTFDWMEDRPHLAPTDGPFSGAPIGDLDRNRNNIAFDDIPGLSF
jgi:hypothetical protein